MNYEERYNQALERAKKVHDGELTISPNEVNDFNVYEYIFPELRESEDERIRKELLDHCINRRDGKPICVDASDYRRWAAWLEKQGEKSWSEEDDDNIKCICSYLELYLNHTADINEIEECKYLKDWLKSFKSNHWKPSEEQLNALKQCIGGYYSEEADKKLESLYDDLKKL